MIEVIGENKAVGAETQCSIKDQGFLVILEVLSVYIGRIESVQHILDDSLTHIMFVAVRQRCIIFFTSRVNAMFYSRDGCVALRSRRHRRTL